MSYARALLILTVVFLINFTASAQLEGCTDSIALNYNPEAVINDGTCQYKPKSFKPPSLIRKLPKIVTESSGLIYWRDNFWTHNDSDSKNEIYKFDQKSGKIIQTISVANALNVDWEEITQDDFYLYIGDFGNNFGNRTDLSIYKISKLDIPSEGDTSVIAEVISYSYGDQEDFRVRNLSNDFDCEAMLSFGDSLYLFSKNWISGTSRLYALPKIPGNYYIYPLDEFDVNGLITGAAIDFEHKQVVLCGYRNYFPFIWILNDFQKNDFFGGNKRRIDFRELFGTQTEAVTYTSDGVFVISCEKTPVQKARLFKLEGFAIRN